MSDLATHEVEIVLRVTTTHEDIQAALIRSGLVAGELIGEALIDSVEVYSPDPGDVETS